MKKIMKTNDLGLPHSIVPLLAACGTLEEIDEDNDVIKTDDLQRRSSEARS